MMKNTLKIYWHFLLEVMVLFLKMTQRFCNDIQIPEVKCFYGFQRQENIHSEMYSLLIDTLVKDASRKTELLNAETIPSVQKKAKWALKWISDKESNYATRLVAFAAVEGIFFSGAFCALFWLKREGFYQVLRYNELISRDEALHTEFAVLIYNMLKEKLDDSKLKEIITEKKLKNLLLILFHVN